MRFGILALFVVACSGNEGSPDDANIEIEDPVSVVEVGEASLGEVSELLTSSAVVESEASADLVPEATGIVRRVLRDEGDSVERGDVLAVLDNVSLDTGAERARAEVARLEQQMSETKALYDQGAVSQRELDDITFQLDQARRQAREATKTFGSTRITAPFDGVVATRNVTLGELATSAAPAFQIVDPTRLRVVTSVPERDLARVAVGQSARLVSAYDETIGTTGSVQRISPVVDSTSGTFRVTIGVDDPTKLRPGQFVSVKVVVDRREDVLVIPKRALLYQEGRPVVFTLGPLPEVQEAPEPEPEPRSWFGGSDEPEDKEQAEPVDPPTHVAVRRTVELGLADEDSVQIVKGLEQGEAIITLGHTHLRDGAKIRIAKPASQDAERPAKPTDTTGSKG